MVYGEVGKLPLQVTIDKRFMSFWLRLLNKEPDKLVWGVGSWPSNRATEGSNPKGTRLYFVILLKNVEKIFD